MAGGGQQMAQGGQAAGHRTRKSQCGCAQEVGQHREVGQPANVRL